MVQLVIFDMAGTSINEDNLVYKTIQQSMTSHGVPVSLELVLEHGAGKEKRTAIGDIAAVAAPEGVSEEWITKVHTAFKKELDTAYDTCDMEVFPSVKQVIKVLKDAGDDYNVAMIYLSDHGESLGENGLYLHGTPYAFAPKEQTHIPWLMWLPKPYTEAKNIDANCLKNNAKTKKYSHDNLFHSLLGLYGIKTAIKDKNLDITEQCSSM